MAESHRGKFVWYELMTTDTEAAKSFYGKVTGWGAEKWAASDMPYTMFVAKSGPVAGLMELPPELKGMGVPPHWLTYIGVDDVDASTVAAAAAGGTVKMPGMDIPNVGRFSVVQDPQGAVFAFFKGSNEPPPGEKDPLGQIGWHELNTTDHVSALTFYSQLVGWEKSEAMDMGGDFGTYQMFRRPGTTDSLGGTGNTIKFMPPGVPPHWLIYVNVASLSASIAAVKANGGRLLNEPMQVPGGSWVASCMDPQGAAFALVSKVN